MEFAACSAFVVFFIIAILVLNIVLLVWVARDAKARGMDNSVLWMLVVFFLGHNWSDHLSRFETNRQSSRVLKL